MPSAVESAIRHSVTGGIMKLAKFNRSRMKAPADGNPYLQGIHKPMTGEVTLNDLAVAGSIPPELNGRYLRNGPNPVRPPQEAAYHWFLGDAMLHGLRLKDGKALWYRNRWVRSNAVSRALGEDPAPGARHMLSDNANTNVFGHAGNTYAIVEAGGNPVRVDADLNTIEHDPFGGTLKGTFSAHPHLDPDTGEQHAICYNGFDQNTLHHVVVGKDGKVRREEPIPVKHGPMVHDCMITKNYVIVLDLPVTFSMKKLIGGHGFPYAWNPAHRARVGLLPREGKGTDTIWCEVDPCYLFHPCNAYEDAHGKVIFDACVHDSMFAESNFGPDSKAVPFERWTIDPVAKKVAREVVDAASQEFPRPNETLMGKPYRYAYTMALPDGGDAAFLSQTQLYKHDLQARTKVVRDFGQGNLPGEFVFVPKANAQAEDDGWMMGFVVNTQNDTTDFVIFDAAHFDGPAQATITLPHRIPPGFHGNWVAEA
jgi:8'-apo-carotenoid 13,14-cleaving dioxygenase